MGISLAQAYFLGIFSNAENINFVFRCIFLKGIFLEPNILWNKGVGGEASPQ